MFVVLQLKKRFILRLSFIEGEIALLNCPDLTEGNLLFPNLDRPSSANTQRTFFLQQRKLPRIMYMWNTFGLSHSEIGPSLVSQIENLPAMRETQIQFLGQEDPLEKGVATHSSIPVWRIDRGACWVIVYGVAKSRTQVQ